jgi:capsular polysaccharide transport system ATP-binding protein
MIRLNDVKKIYRIEGDKRVILDRVSAVFESGQSYALLGVNGAGKSTTIRLMAGTEEPDSGKIRRNVRVSWPLGLGSMFHPTISARENSHFVARLYGEDPRRTARYVADFAEIGDYFDAPIKTYSSGMMARFAFGLSMAIDFDCYLIDEVMSVGDARFQTRCEEVFKQRVKNADLIVVSHSMTMVERFCTRGAVLVDGRLIMYDAVAKAVEMYNRLNR